MNWDHKISPPPEEDLRLDDQEDEHQEPEAPPVEVACAFCTRGKASYWTHPFHVPICEACWDARRDHAMGEVLPIPPDAVYGDMVIRGHHPLPTDEHRERQRQQEEERKECYRQRSESYDRCQEDGWLSQWAQGIQAGVHAMQAKIELQGGTDLFKGLFDKSGRRLDAVLIEGRWGRSWMVKTARGERRFYPSGPRSRKQRQDGLHEEMEWAPARAYIAGHGHGLSGSAWASTERTDGGCPKQSHRP